MRRNFKRVLTILFCLTFISMQLFATTGKDKSSINKKVKSLLAKMTLEEKVGQMTQLSIQSFAKTHGTATEKFQVDDSKLKEAIIKYHIGSILNVYDVALSIEDWNKLISDIQDDATKETRLKIPILYGIDAIHGATYTIGSTLFPQAINMAATFNKELAKKEGEITALEVRASGIPWIYYPVMDLGRQPLWPRLWETYGEDVYLDSQMGENFIKGAQGNNIGDPDKVGTCLKHFVGYSFPLDGKDRTPAWIPERMMKEYFLPPFQAGVDAGSPTVMVNSSDVNGIPGHSNYHLLTEVLKNKMKFKGFVDSDWQDIERLYSRDKVASTPEDAVRMAVMAGVDMSMVPLDFSFYNILIKLVKEGKVPISRIDDAVSRILKVKFQMGLFKNPYPNEKLIKQFASKSSEQTNLEASEESISLVKNENNILPLSKNLKVLVTGPTANMLSPLNGGWTITWQGNEESLYPKDKPTILAAIKEKIGAGNVTYVQGSTFDSLLDVEDAVSAAKKVDAVVLCLGEKAYCETPGNIDDLTLDDAQLDLAKDVISAGKPVILVMIEGRPRIINKIVVGSKSILIGFLPGMEGGRALANIIFGDANPSGRLSVTYPRFPNALYHYDYKPLEIEEGNVYNPQWNFGYGLSYSSFTYSDLKLNKDLIRKGQDIEVSVIVKNTSRIAGKESVLLYLGDLIGSVSRPVKQLKGFDKIYLKPNESKEVKFVIKPEQLSFIGRDNKRIIEPGRFKVTIGNLTKEFTLQ